MAPRAIQRIFWFPPLRFSHRRRRDASTKSAHRVRARCFEHRITADHHHRKSPGCDQSLAGRAAHGLSTTRRGGLDSCFRATVQQNRQPDFSWTPYPAFVTPLTQGANSFGGAWLRWFNSSLTNEARASDSLPIRSGSIARIQDSDSGFRRRRDSARQSPALLLFRIAATISNWSTT